MLIETRASIYPGETPYNDLHGEAPPELRNGYIFKTSGVVEVYERVGKSVSFWSVKRPKRGNRRILWLRKSRDNFLVFWFIHSLKTAHITAAKSNAKFQTRYLKGVPFVNWRYCVREGYLFSQKKYIERKGAGPQGGASQDKTLLRNSSSPGGHRCFLSQTVRIRKRTSCPYIQKKHFSLFKSVTGDHLGFKCKNNYGKSIKGSTTKGSYESRLFKSTS